MGSGLARRLSVLSLGLLIGLAGTPVLAEPSGCGRDGCAERYFNAVTDHGNVELSIDSRCLTAWRHVWGERDARRTIRQWLDKEADGATGGVCIPVDERVTGFRVTSLGGHCGYAQGTANEPRANMTLRPGHADRPIVTGCHATLAGARFGGIALRFADGYGLGDSYLRGYFYGVYDGFGEETVAPFGKSVFTLAEHNTYRYRIELMAGTRPWQPNRESDR